MRSLLRSGPYGFLIGGIVGLCVMYALTLGRCSHDEPKCPPSESPVTVPAPAMAATPAKTSTAPEYTSGRAYKKGEIVDIKVDFAPGCYDNPDRSCNLNSGGKLTVVDTTNPQVAVCTYQRPDGKEERYNECRNGTVACELLFLKLGMDATTKQREDLKRIFNK